MPLSEDLSRGGAPAGAEVTDLLRAWSGGDRRALAELMERVYRELKAMAAAQLRSERGDHTLQATALVHEAFLRLVDQERADWQCRAQFFDVAARMMRRILVDHARRRSRLKRGGGVAGLDPAPALGPPLGTFEDVLALDQALKRLEGLAPRQARIIELHFFAGLSVAETADVVGCSESTVSRDWRLARLWLARELGSENGDGP